MIYIVIFLSFLALWLISKRPTLFFWIIILMLFDPGGFMRVYANKSMLGGFDYKDIFFMASFVPMAFAKLNFQSLKERKYQKFYRYLLFFLIYQLLVFGFITSDVSWSYYFRDFIVKERYTIFSIFIIIPVYLFAIKNLELLYKVIVISSIIILTSYFITLLTPLNLLEVAMGNRYQNSDILRYGLLGEGLIFYTLPIGLLIYYFNLKIQYRQIAIISGALYIISIIITLTKSSLLGTIGIIFFTLYLSSRLYKKRVSKLLSRIALPIFIVYLFLHIAFPHYIDYTIRGFQDMYLIVSTGEKTTGEREGRLDQIPALIDRIKQHPYFGSGANKQAFYASAKGEEHLLDTTDLPLLGHIATYGIIGISLYLVIYIMIIILIVNIYRLLKKDIGYFLHNNMIDVLFAISISALFLRMFTFRFFVLFVELTRDRFGITIMTGILLAVYYRLRESYLYKIQLQQNDNEIYSKKNKES